MLGVESWALGTFVVGAFSGSMVLGPGCCLLGHMCWVVGARCWGHVCCVLGVGRWGHGCWVLGTYVMGARCWGHVCCVLGVGCWLLVARDMCYSHPPIGSLHLQVDSPANSGFYLKPISTKSLETLQRSLL